MRRTAHRSARFSRNRKLSGLNQSVNSAPLTVLKAWATATPTNFLVLSLSAPVTEIDPFSTDHLHDFTEVENAAFVGFLYSPMNLVVLFFPTSVNRVGHRVGWDGTVIAWDAVSLPQAQTADALAVAGSP